MNSDVGPGRYVLTVDGHSLTRGIGETPMTKNVPSFHYVQDVHGLCLHERHLMSDVGAPGAAKSSGVSVSFTDE